MDNFDTILQQAKETLEIVRNHCPGCMVMKEEGSGMFIAVPAKIVNGVCTKCVRPVYKPK
jgi:hypothetical protein